MLFFIPLLAVTTLLQALIPGVPTPETFTTIDAAARGTDVSLWILQQCPSTAVTLAELELALQLGSSNALVYSAPLGLHVWQSSPSVRAWGRTLVTTAEYLLSASGVKLDSRRHSTHHTRAPGLGGLPNGTLAGWCTRYARPGCPGHISLALIMARIGLPSPAILTLPAPALVLTLPAPRPILTLPAPAPILTLPAPKPVLSVTILGTTSTSPTPKPTRTLPGPIFTPFPVKASPTSETVPTLPASNFEGHALPSPGPVPFCARPTASLVVPLSRSASRVSSAPPTPTRGFYPVITKPIAHSTIRRWHNHLLVVCLVVLTLGSLLARFNGDVIDHDIAGFHLAASRSLEGLVWHLVGVYDLDGETLGGHDGFGYTLDPFGKLATDIFSTERPRILSGLAPDMPRFCGECESVDTATEDGIPGEHDELERTLDPFDGLTVDAPNVVRSGKLGGLAPDLFRFCSQPELPDAALGDAFDRPLGLAETTGVVGEGTREEVLALEDGPAETKEAEDIDGVTASSNIQVDGARQPESVPGPDDTHNQTVDGQLESGMEDTLEAPHGFLETDSGAAGVEPRKDAELENVDTGCEEAPDGLLEVGSKPVETVAEEKLETRHEEVGVGMQGGERSVGTAANRPDGSINDSSRGLGDSYTPGAFAWSDEPEELSANDTTPTAGIIGRIEDLLSELKREPRQRKPGPSNPEAERERGGRRAQVGGSGRREGHRGGQGSEDRGEWGSGAQNRGWDRGGKAGAYSGGGSGGYGGGRSGSGNGGNGGSSGSYRGGGGGGAGGEGRNSNRRESKATYFVRLRKERKAADREAAEN